MDAARLDAIPLFAGLTLDQRASVAGSYGKLAVAAGSTLVQEGFGSARSPCCREVDARPRW